MAYGPFRPLGLVTLFSNSSMGEMPASREKTEADSSWLLSYRFTQMHMQTCICISNTAPLLLEASPRCFLCSLLFCCLKHKCIMDRHFKSKRLVMESSNQRRAHISNSLLNLDEDAGGQMVDANRQSCWGETGTEVGSSEARWCRWPALRSVTRATSSRRRGGIRWLKSNPGLSSL